MIRNMSSCLVAALKGGYTLRLKHLNYAKQQYNHVHHLYTKEAVEKYHQLVQQNDCHVDILLHINC